MKRGSSGLHIPEPHFQGVHPSQIRGTEPEVPLNQREVQLPLQNKMCLQQASNESRASKASTVRYVPVAYLPGKGGALT